MLDLEKFQRSFIRIFPFIWPNLQVHQELFCHEDSRKRHVWKVESWQGSWCNFHRSFWGIIPINLHHLSVHQEPPLPPRLREETGRGSKGKDLTGLLFFFLDENITVALYGCYNSLDPISRSIMSLQERQERILWQKLLLLFSFLFVTPCILHFLNIRWASYSLHYFNGQRNFVYIYQQFPNNW